MPVERESGTGWNVITKYNPGVLIGNWQEERMVVSKLIENFSHHRMLAYC